MFDIRNTLNSTDNASSTLQEDLFEQLNGVEEELLDHIETIDTDPLTVNVMGLLNTEANYLENEIKSNILTSISNRTTSAISVDINNNAISCTSLPCQLEKQLNALYLETQIIAPRELTSTELEFVHEIALKCHAEAGSVIYLAQAWYYLATGEILRPICSQGVFGIEGIEERNQKIAMEGFSISPNPTNDVVHISISSSMKGGIVSIRDTWGKLVFQQSVSDDANEDSVITLNTEIWQQGVYFVSRINKYGTRFDTQKMIVTR